MATKAAWFAVCIVLDSVAVSLSLGASLWIGGRAAAEWLYLLPSGLAIVLLSLSAVGMYRGTGAHRDVLRLFRAIILAGLILSVAVVYYPWLEISTTELWVFLPLSSVLVLGGRLCWARVYRRIPRPRWTRDSVLMIGDHSSAMDLLDRLRRDGAEEIVVGHLAEHPSSDPTALGGLDLLEEVIERRMITGVIIATDLPAATFQDVVQRCFRLGVGVQLVVDFPGPIPARVRSTNVAGMPVLDLRPVRTPVPELAIKRLIDIVGSAIGLLLLSPLFLLIAILIRLDSEGPIFFGQERVGLGGRTFKMWKFRSMYSDADSRKQEYAHLIESGDPRLFKIKDDPRVTRVGRIIRRYSLDELPQLWNVLLGEMSFVGPRPFFESDLDLYEPHHFERLAVVPGITGLWQVSGRSEITDFEEVVRLDREYIRNWTLSLDLRILLLTFPAVLRRTGAF